MFSTRLRPMTPKPTMPISYPFCGCVSLISLAQIGSPLPPDSCVFQWDRNAFAVRDDPRCIVPRSADRGHGRAVPVAARRSGQLADALHLLSHWAAAVNTVGIKLNGYSARVEVIEIDLNVEDMLLAFSLHRHFTKAQRRPFLFQTMPPIKHLPANCPFFGTAQVVGGCGREVVLLGIFAHRAVSGKARSQPRHAFPHPPDPGRGHALCVTGMKLRDHLPFEPLVKNLRLGGVPRRIIAVLLAIPQRPPQIRDIGLRSEER